MMPSDAADEIREHNVRLSPHRLAELLSVIDGRLWSPDDPDALQARLHDYMRLNMVRPARSPDQV